MKKLLKRLLILVLALTVLITILAGWALYTPSGADFVLSRATSVVPGELRWDSVDGSLASQLSLNSVHYADPAIEASAEQLSIAMRPRFSPLSVIISNLEASGLKLIPVTDESNPDKEPLNIEELLSALQLPLTVEIGHMQLGPIQYGEGEDALRLDLLELSGRWHSELELDSLKARLDDKEWTANLKVSLKPPHKLAGRLEQISMAQAATQAWVAFDGTPDALALDFAAMPAEQPELHGGAVIRLGSEQIGFSDLELRADGTPFSASGYGLLDLAQPSLEGQFEWFDFQWPLTSATPGFSSSAGRASLEGTPDDWVMQGEIDIDSSGFQAGQVIFSGSGDMHSAHAEVTRAEVLNGSVSGWFKGDWSEAFDWSAEISAAEIETDVLLPDLPGSLNFQALAEGSGGIENLAVTLHQLDGSLRGLPVNAGGNFWLNGDQWRLENLRIDSGSSSVLADGGPWETPGLNLQLTDVDLQLSEAILKDTPVSGILNGSLNVLMGGPTPSIRGSLLGSALVYGDTELSEIELTVSGDRPLSIIELSLRNDLAELETRLNGVLNDWNDAARANWSGQIEQLRILPSDYKELTLLNPAPLKLSSRSMSLQAACLSGAAESELCVDVNWEPEALSAKARLNEISLNALALMTQSPWRYSQLLNGELNIEWPSGGEISGSGRIDLSSGFISLADDESVAVATGEGLAQFEIVSGSLRNGQIDLDLPGNGLLDIDFNLSELEDHVASPINGTVRAELADVGSIWQLIPVFDTVDGTLNLDARLSGELGQPVITGRLDFNNGTFIHELSGLTLSEISLNGDFSSDQTSSLEGRFMAGDGEGQLALGMDMSDPSAPLARLEIAGQGLKLISTPDLELAADPDIRLEWQDQQLTIDGRIYVPDLVLSPTQLPVTAATESADVNIIAGQAAVEKPAGNSSDELALDGTIEVELGSNVRIDLDIAELKLDGKTRFEWQGQKMPMADGRFDLSGEILAFGQRLEVANGRIGFPGVPADDPHLDIRAERRIYGNAQVQRAGLLITGTLRRILTEAYTVPMTTKERAQTLLVTGSDFDYEQGVGAVSIGTYILPRLFVSYGIGVFEDGNVVSARFDLSERFGVKATSGERDTGMDLTYTIEK